MGFNYGTAAVGGSQGAQAGYNLGGPWGAAIGGVAGTLAGGFGFGGDAGMPGPGPLAGMSDAEYAWYQQNIAPLQQKAYSQAFGASSINSQLGQAKSTADTQSANAGAAFTRQAAAQGIALSPAQKADAAKQQALGVAASEASALNTTRASIGRQQSGILGTG